MDRATIAELKNRRGHDDPGGRLTRLEAADLVRPPLRPLPLDVLKGPAPTSRTSVLQALLEERDEER